MATAEARFEFGRNWRKFVERSYSEERLEASRKHLLEFLGVDDLAGRSFLDIGCGSGLHSLAAFKSGAARIVSFDFDEIAVETTQRLRQLAGNPPSWQARRGSILDRAFLESLDAADIVYSWGVLHHTGDVWSAMTNAGALVKPGGLFYVALYDSAAYVDPPPEFWLDVKQRYVRSGPLRRRTMELGYIWRFSLNRRLRNLPGFVRRTLAESPGRGMAYYRDLVDWLGGWPMEFTKQSDVLDWARSQGFRNIRMKAGEGNTEYLFQRA